MRPLIKQTLNLIRKSRLCNFATATQIPNNSNIHFRRSMLSSPDCNRNSFFKLMLAAPTAVLFGLGVNTVYADSGSEVLPVGSGDGQGEVDVFGLRKVEDGSIVSNEHTIKWRIFTDNGRDMFMKGKYDEAEKFFKAAIQEAKEGFGSRDAHVASAYNNLAEFYRVRKAYEKAEHLYLDAINILEEAFSTDDVRVGAALHNLGQFYLVQRKLEQAQKCYERALKIEGRVLGHGHTDYANTMYHLGMVLHLLGKEKDSEDLITESIRILEEGGLGETTACVRRMKYLSQMFLSSNRLDEAEKLQRKILHIFELSKGWDSLETIIAAESLALTLQTLGSLKESQDLLERCLDARKKILPHDHIQVASNMLHLGRVAMHKSNYLRKVNISEATGEIEKAKSLVDDSIRISKVNLQSNGASKGNLKDQRMALLVLLQSLDFVGLLDVTKSELLKPEEEKTLCDTEFALRECISIVKEPAMKKLLNSPDVKNEYISCLKHLKNVVSDSIDSDTEKSSNKKKLIDEAQSIETELSNPRRQNVK